MLLIIALFFGCSKDDSSSSCTPIACLNGGVSTFDCGCNCPQGYIGSNCGTQVTPTSIKITKIRVKKFPNNNPDGDQWDNLAVGNFVRPDLNIDIKFGATVLYDSNVLNDNISNLNCTDTYDFFPNLTLNSTNFNNQLTFRLFDYDGLDQYEFIGGYNSPIYSSTTGFPTTLPIGTCDNTIVFELTLSYVW